jgi:hypothetical protein
MRCVGIKKRRIARRQFVSRIQLPTNHSALQDVNKLDAGMLKNRKYLGVFVQRNQTRLNRYITVYAVAKQLILMHGALSFSLDRQFLAGSY